MMQDLSVREMNFHTTWWYARALFLTSKIKGYLFLVYLVNATAITYLFEVTVMIAVLIFWSFLFLFSIDWLDGTFKFPNGWRVDNLSLDSQQLQFIIRQWSTSSCFNTRYASSQVYTLIFLIKENLLVSIKKGCKREP